MEEYIYNVQHHVGCTYQNAKQLVLKLTKDNHSASIEEIVTDSINIVYYNTRNFNWI